ncbi:hypothetical protein D3C75_1119130 [compost metagenome]
MIPSEYKSRQAQQGQIHQGDQLVGGQWQPLIHVAGCCLDTVHRSGICQYQTGSGAQEQTAGQSGQGRVLHQRREGMEQQGNPAKEKEAEGGEEEAAPFLCEAAVNHIRQV